jgi:hypothetical protein
MFEEACVRDKALDAVLFWVELKRQDIGTSERPVETFEYREATTKNVGGWVCSCDDRPVRHIIAGYVSREGMDSGERPEDGRGRAGKRKRRHEVHGRLGLCLKGDCASDHSLNGSRESPGVERSFGRIGKAAKAPDLTVSGRGKTNRLGVDHPWTPLLGEMREQRRIRPNVRRLDYRATKCLDGRPCLWGRDQFLDGSSFELCHVQEEG